MNNRWALLEHRTSQENIFYGFHFDLLLEEGSSCRTWRLESVPILDGPSVLATRLPSHKLHWLTTEQSIVSGGRGWAKRMEGGIFLGALPISQDEAISIELVSETISGGLEIYKTDCRLFTLGNSVSFK